MAATVLLVEDEPDLVHVMEIALTRAGFDVLATGSGAGACSVAQEHRPDVVVMDRGLPDMDGLDATVRLRENGYRAPILVVSGHASTDHVEACLRAGADVVLTKPFRLAELVAQVHQAIAPVADAG